jgi:hypothetical protein
MEKKVDKKQKLKDFFDKLGRKNIFVCSSQTVKMNGHTYKDVPHCDYVQISFEDYNKLRELIISL